MTKPIDTTPSARVHTAAEDKPQQGTQPAPAERAHHQHRDRESGQTRVREVRGLRVGVRIAVILVVLIGAFLVFGALSALRPESGYSSEPPPPLLVRAVDAQPREVERVWQSFGTVASMQRARVAAEVTGRVIERPARIEPGRSVEANGLLVALDPVDYRASVVRSEQAAVALRAQLDGLAVESERISSQLELVADEIEAAERDLDRTRRAVEQGAGSQGELDSRLAELRRSQREQQTLRQQIELIPSRRLALQGDLGAVEADLELARENLARTRVVSPIAGEIESVEPRVGDWVLAGNPVGVVVDLTRLEVPLRVPASAAAWIRVGDPVSLWAGEPVGVPSHTGLVTRLGPAADAATRTIAVFVEVSQDPLDESRLLPGVFAHGRISTEDRTERIAVPRKAILSGRVMALVPVDAELHEVRAIAVKVSYSIDATLPDIDPAETEWAILEDGAALPADALVATTALDQLVPGMRVRVQGPGETGEADNEGSEVSP
ncbi:MAG: HlyD family efflux transporter periplasmic adaptor subunit [Planctomycetota bacterium]